MYLPPGARAECDGNRADGVLFRRRAVQCRILLPVIFRAFGSAYCTISAVDSGSSDTCKHPSFRLVSWPSSPRDRWMRVWRRPWRKPGISLTAWGRSSCRRRSASRCVELIRERNEARLPRALRVVLVRKRPWWFQLQPTDNGQSKLRSTQTSSPKSARDLVLQPARPQRQSRLSTSRLSRTAVSGRQPTLQKLRPV